MNEIESDDLIEALEGIVSNFSDAIGPYTVGLIEGLAEAYYKYKGVGSTKDDNAGVVDELIGTEGCRAAEACLDTINNILRLNIDDQVY